MKILAVDTAGKSCSVCIADNNGVIVELTVNHVLTHASVLMNLIHHALDISSLHLEDIYGTAITIGPGSFTGLRIGLSAVKGLSTATGKPLVGVSSLEALAHGVPYTDFWIMPVIDARKGQVYCALYKYHGDQLIRLRHESSLTPQEAVQDITHPCIFIGDGAWVYQDKIKMRLGPLAYVAPPVHHTIKASIVAMLSRPRFLKGDTDDLETLVPTYIRKSDAEIAKDLRQH